MENNKIYFAKLREGAIIPSKEVENAGMDIYACFEENYIEIGVGEIKLIPTGICSAFSDDYVLMLKERGSTGTKGMSQKCGIIDSGFRNEIFVPINNTSNKSIVIAKDIDAARDIIIQRESEHFDYDLEITTEFVEEYFIFYPYKKAITQGLLLPIPKVQIEEISSEELQSIPSKRGMGMLGSSGK